MSDAPLDDDDFTAVKRSTWPLYLFLIALLGAGGWFGWSMYRATDPQTVLVAIDLDGHWFEGSLAAAALADELNGRLEALGFTPIRPGDPDVVATLEGQSDLRAAARSLGAGFVITGTVTPEVIEHPIAGGYHEVRATGEVSVFHVDDADTGEAASVRGWSGAKDRERAMRLVATGGLSLLAVGETIPRLVQHPVLAALLDKDARALAQLQPAANFVGDHVQKLKTARKAYEGYGKRRAMAEKGPVPVTVLGPISASDAFCGVGPAGHCVKTEATRPYVSPRTGKLRMLEELETIEWRPLTPPAEGAAPGGDARWSGYNVFGYPQISSDGQYVGFIEDLYGWAKAPSLIGPEGEAKRLLIDPDRRFSTPIPAPGGQALAVYVRAERRAPAGLLVLDANGETLRELPPMGDGFGGFGWLDARTLLVLHTPAAPEVDEVDDAGDEGAAKEPAPDAEAPAVLPEPTEADPLPGTRQTLWRLSLDTPLPTRIYVTAEGERLSWPTISPDGERVAFRRRHPEGSGLGVLSLGPEPSMLTIGVAGRADSPRFSPDGQKLVFTERRGDEEIALVDLSAEDPAASVTYLTDNTVRDRYPAFSPDGKQILFEQLGEDPNHSRRSLGVVASVPVP